MNCKKWLICAIAAFFVAWGAEPDLSEQDGDNIRKICENRKINLRDYTSYFYFPEEIDSRIQSRCFSRQ